MSLSEQSSSQPQAGDPLELVIKGVKAVFRYCPPGRFLMGSPEDEAGRYDNETQHEVTLTRGFWLLETPVTQRLWEAVMQENPSEFKGAAARPVETVSWEDCDRFIENLNSAGLAPEGLMYDFPTESEWEYACRAGATTPFNFGTALNGDKANCYGHNPYGTTEEGVYVGETTPVKSYAPNAWGLYDMHGNVYEWCKDWYGDYPAGSVTDPTGPSSGSARVIRGGGWGNGPWSCRSAYRDIRAPEDRGSYVGFRLSLRSSE